MLRIIFFILAIQCLFVQAYAQGRDTVPAVKLPQKAASPYNPKEEIVVKGKRFRVYNNWVNVGSGEGINSALPWTQYVLDVDLHFHFGKQYIQLGTFLSGDRFLAFNNYSAHLCYGKRWENISRNIFICAGPSYSWGFPLVHGIYDVNVYHLTGVCAQATYIFKQAYDLGIGLTAFGDVNSKQSVYGLRLELYFSGAYRGEGRKKAGWMK
jgi:hypothetical protein